MFDVFVNAVVVVVVVVLSLFLPLLFVDCQRVASSVLRTTCFCVCTCVCVCLNLHTYATFYATVRHTKNLHILMLFNLTRICSIAKGGDREKEREKEMAGRRRPSSEE